MSDALALVAAAANYGINSILVRPARFIGPLAMQVVVEEVHHDELEITQHPVELGAPITDHAFMRPREVIIRGGWSDSPSVAGLFAGAAAGLAGTVAGVQSMITGNNVSQSKDMYAKLLKLQESRTLMEVYTGKRYYRNMLIKSMSSTTDKTNERSVFITVTLVEVLVVQTQVLTITAPMENQANAALTAQPINSGAKALQLSTQFNPAPGSSRSTP